MEAFETEDQQVEAIKKWWRENYKLVIIVAIGAVAGILGSQYYQENKILVAEAASDNFNAVLSAVDNKQGEIVADRTALLQKDFKSSPYTAQATLLLAKNLAEAGSNEQAIEKLLWVENNSDDKSLQQIALIQRAQLIAGSGKQQQALSLLQNNKDAGAFTAVSLETQGDILVSMDRLSDAKKVYDEAMGKYLLVGSNVDILQIKRNDLGN
jgi:predicted negative regulator of RcsB-dependent stress response